MIKGPQPLTEKRTIDWALVRLHGDYAEFIVMEFRELLAKSLLEMDEPLAKALDAPGGCVSIGLTLWPGAVR